MSSDEPSQPGSSTRGAVRTGRRRRKLKIVGLSLAGLLVVGAGTGVYAYEDIFGKIQSVSLDKTLALTKRPAVAKANAQGQTPLNILVLGSQTRNGQTGVDIGSTDDTTDLSDTAMLVHLSADRKWSVVVSIPRDLIVPRPACFSRVGYGDQTSSSIYPASSAAMFDDAMSYGGPSCAVATVEQMTGIRIDHFVEMDFDAFKSLTNDVGGVEVCIPEPGIDDKYSGLDLKAGSYNISGNAALEFVRDRHGLASGMDTDRIEMQQMFSSSLFKKLSSNGTLSDPITLFKIANDVASNMTVDTGLDSPTAMVSLAESVKSLNPRYMQYITAPYILDPANINRLLPDLPGGFEQVWADLRVDQPLPGSAAATAFGTKAAATPKPSASPSGIALSSLKVSVYNGTDSDTDAPAVDAAAALKAEGVNASVGGGADDIDTTEIEYPAGQEAQAKVLQNDILGSQIEADSSVSTLTLVLGANAPANLINPPTTGAGASPAPSISAETRTGDENSCADLPTTTLDSGSPDD